MLSFSRRAVKRYIHLCLLLLPGLFPYSLPSVLSSFLSWRGPIRLHVRPVSRRRLSVTRCYHLLPSICYHPFQQHRAPCGPTLPGHVAPGTARAWHVAVPAMRRDNINGAVHDVERRKGNAVGRTAEMAGCYCCRIGSAGLQHSKQRLSGRDGTGLAGLVEWGPCNGMEGPVAAREGY